MTAPYTYDFSMTAGDVVRDAMTEAGVLQDGESPSGNAMDYGLRRLNMLIKNIMGPNNTGMRGLKMFQRTSASIALDTATNVFAVGSQPEECDLTDTGDLVEKTAHGLANGDWVKFIEINDTTGITEGTTYYVVNKTDDNFQVAATIGGAALALTTDGDGKYVTHAIYSPPVAILSCLLRNTDNEDVPLTPMLLEEYQQIGNKTESGTPTRYYYERQVDAGYIYLDVQPEDATDTLELVILRALEDIDSLSDTVLFSPEWYRPLVLAMALELSPSYGVPPNQATADLSRQAFNFANSFEPEQVSAFFEPDKD